MRCSKLGTICVGLLLGAIPVAGSMIDMDGGGSGPLPLLLTVGTDAACSHSTLQAALNTASSAGPENDIVRIATHHADASISAEIFAHSVTIEGGYASCSSFVPAGRTVLDGTGGTAGSVLTIWGGNAEDRHIVILRNLVISGGEDDGFGGGIDISGGMGVRLENSIVEDNESTRGGGISTRGGSAAVTLEDFSQVLNNRAHDVGGGVFCADGYASAFDSAIAFNEAARGGGVAVDQGCSFRLDSGGPLRGVFLNTASIQGGGIYVRGGGELELNGTSAAPASVVSNTAASTGGGIWLTDGTARTRNARIDSNIAGLGGGVGVGVGGSFRMERRPDGICHAADRCSTLSGNVADRGGALYVNSSTGSAEVYQTYVEGNMANLEGSAAYLTVSADLSMEGVVLAENQGGESVIKLRGGTEGRLAFVTMTRNQASEAVIVTRDDTFGDADGLEIYSSILWETSTGPLLEPGGTPLSLDCLIVDDSSGLPGDYISVVPPVFLDALAGDYHLHPSSPAVDYCDTAAYSPKSTDLDLQERGWDHPEIPDQFLISWYDIGADELNLAAPIFVDGFETGNTSMWSATVP
ncbi:MAG: hypothetical protein MPN21_01715 [Thermoanaerobaculia bacterium]|nr:hypothetical protein [Thermoanaerobaculia bacterium]